MLTLINYLFIFSYLFNSHDLSLKRNYNKYITENVIYTIAMYPNHDNSIWVKYGPLKLNKSSYRKKGYNIIFQGYNSINQPIYLAINCLTSKINVTDSKLNWKRWFKADKGFEIKMINETCKKL